MRSSLFQHSFHSLIRKREIESFQFKSDPFFFHPDSQTNHSLTTPLPFNSGSDEQQKIHNADCGSESFQGRSIDLCHVNILTSRPYCCSFSNSTGSFYYYASQDHTVTFKKYKTNETILEFGATVGQWTITSYDLSHNSQFLAYTSLVPYVHLASLPSLSQIDRLVIDNAANTANLSQQVLDFSSGFDDSFGLFSIKFSRDGKELVAGSNTDSIYLYDIQSTTLLHRIEGHQDDVNSVVFMDSSSSNVIASASDDSLIKVWDKRSLPSTASSATAQPAGTLIGHTEGVTHLDAKGDGRYLISNGKDQSLKLWDIRQLKHGEGERVRLDICPQWDYRWESYPLPKSRTHPLDSSLKTFSSHSVLRTLIRCYFSPSFSTGSRFVYTGSADGVVKIYDTLSEDVMSINAGGVVRDLSWHPFDDYFIVGSWREGGGGMGRRGWANHGGDLLHYEPNYFAAVSKI